MDNHAYLSKISHFLLTASPPDRWLLMAFFINFLVGYFVSWLCINFMPLEITRNKKYFFYLLLALCTFIPLIGAIVVLILVLFLKKYGKDFTPVTINTYKGLEYTRKNPRKSKAYGAGWALLRLGSKNFHFSERTQALNSINRGAPRDMNAIYNKLVSDDIEELRICAFSMLELQRDFFQKRINFFLKKIEKNAESPEESAFFEKQLALLYWELVYKKLSEKEFKDILLERSEFYAKNALNYLTNDYPLLILLAKIEIEKGAYEEGFEKLVFASKCDAPNSKVLPFLAELAYKRKNYPIVKKYLTMDPSLKYIFKINPVIKFWSKNEQN